jgi:hypothetical protein
MWKYKQGRGQENPQDTDCEYAPSKSMANFASSSSFVLSAAMGIRIIPADFLQLVSGRKGVDY